MRTINMAPSNTPRLRAPDAAAYLGIAPSTLAKMRLRGDGPPYYKVGPRVVVYRPSDLEDWLEANRRRSTSDLIGIPATAANKAGAA
jgi:predicted DNA-binding transcriptional regulator AlpA